MKLLVVDNQGNELKLARVSLIDGGVEIVVGGSFDRPANTVSTATEERNSSDNESAAVGSNGASHASVFDTSSESTGSDVQKSAGSTSSDAGSLPEPNSSAGVEVDKTGRPWDERIDSSNKKQSAKGLWQRRRNVDDDVYASVVAELKAGPAQGSIDLPSPGDELPDPDLDELPDPGDELPDPDAEIPLPEGNTEGSPDDELKDILSGW